MPLLRKYKFDLHAHIYRCEANYYRMVQLLSQNRRYEMHSRSIEIDGHKFELRFEVHREGKFSTIVDLRQQNPVGVPELEMKVLVCHDVRTAEVLKYQGHKRFKVVYAYPNPEMYLPNEKDRVNDFLSELLTNCLTHGLASQREMEEMGVFDSR